MTETTERPQGRRRIGLVDRQAIEASLDIAARALLPEEYSQRDVFRVLMPKLFVMRKRGFGFKQITKLLNDAGLALAIGSVRTYYHEFLMDMLEQCESYFRANELAAKTGAEDSAQIRALPAGRESAIHQAQAQVLNQVNGQAEARTQVLLGRLVGAVEPAPRSGAAGASMAPAPATGLIARPPESPAARGPNPAPVPGGSAPKKTTPLRPASRPKNPPPRPPLVAAAEGAGALTCVTTPEKDQVREEPGLPAEVYTAPSLEHPAIGGLMLDRAQRFYTSRLRYATSDGELKMEKGAEMIARRSWKAPQSVRTGRTSSDFVEMQSSILGKPRT